MPAVDLHSDIQLDLARPGVEPRERFRDLHLPDMVAGEIGLRILATFSQPPDHTASAFRYIAATRAAGLRVLTDAAELEERGPRFLLGLEGAEPYGTDISLVEAFHWAGVRVVGLAWMQQNAVTGACGEPSPGGITSFGARVLDRLGELGAIVDLAHISDQGFDDVLERYEGPLFCSHTCARALREHARNITDEQATGLAARGGIVGVCFFGDFLAGEAGERTLERLVDHVEHFVELIGPERVALGPDWCDYAFDLIRPLSGLASRPVDTHAGYAHGVEDARGLPRLEEALSQRGLPAARIMSENALAFLRDALPGATREPTATLQSAG